MPQRWFPNDHDFIPGLELSRRFFHEAVQPLLARHFPMLVYDAALLGSGSEVLGFDTPMSMDHHWGPRVMLFLRDADCDAYAADIDAVMRQHLPPVVAGFPTSFADMPDDPGVLMFVRAEDGSVNHRVSVTTVRRFVYDEIAYDWRPETPPEPTDWLTFTEQKLRVLTAGAVYHDGIGEVTAMRTQFAYYPRDVWLYVMAAGWERIGQEEAFIGRTGSLGDELGSALIGARLTRDLMRLCFTIERQYAPYPKWFGTAFARLACASALSPVLQRVLAATDWQAREAALVEAYTLVAGLHNALHVTPPVGEVTFYHNRPFRVVNGQRIASALIAEIRDEAVRALSERTRIGAVDQWSDSTSLLARPRLRPALRGLYEIDSEGD